MKYLVELKYTNPSHEHVSLRRKVHSVNRIVEASNPEEAVFRATRQQRALGFMVSEAKVVDEQKPQTSTAETAEVLSEEVKKANFRIRSDDRDGNTHYITRTDGRMSSHNERGRMTALSNHAFRHPGGTEDAERAVRGALHKATNSEDAAARMNASGLGYSNWKPEAHDEDPSSWKYTNEDIEQVEEQGIPYPGEKWKDQAVMVNGRQRIVIDRKNIGNYPAEDGWKEVAPGMKSKKKLGEAAQEIDENAPPGAKYERMVKHIKAKYAAGGLTDAEKRKAYGAAWKAYNRENLEEQGVLEASAFTGIGKMLMKRKLNKGIKQDRKAEDDAFDRVHRYEFDNPERFSHEDDFMKAGDALRRKQRVLNRLSRKGVAEAKDIEQVEEASKKEAPYLAQFVPNADAPMKDHLAFPVHSTDEKEAHRAFERTFGKKMKADYRLHGIFPADVNEGVERVTEGKVSGYKMYRNPDNTWYVEDEDEGVVLRNASQGEAEHMVWSGNQKLKGVADTQPAARKTIKNRMEEEVEQVDEAPRYKHVATFVLLGDSGQKTTLHVPVNVEDGDDEHKNKLARLLGNKRAKKFKLHGVFPRKVVEEEVEQIDESNYVSPMTGKPFTSRLNPLRGRVSPFSKVGKSLMRPKLQSGEDEAAYAATNYDMTQSGMSNLQRNRARLHKAAGRLGVDLYEEEVEQVDEGAIRKGDLVATTKGGKKHKVVRVEKTALGPNILHLHNGRKIPDHRVKTVDVNEEVEQVDEETPARVIAAQKKFDLEAKANAKNTEQAGSAAADRRAEIIRKAKEELAKRKSLAEAKKPDDKKKIVVGGKGANKEKVSVTPSISDDSPDSKPGTERN